MRTTFCLLLYNPFKMTNSIVACRMQAETQTIIKETGLNLSFQNVWLCVYKPTNILPNPIGLWYKTVMCTEATNRLASVSKLHNSMLYQRKRKNKTQVLDALPQFQTLGSVRRCEGSKRFCWPTVGEESYLNRLLEYHTIPRKLVHPLCYSLNN